MPLILTIDTSTQVCSVALGTEYQIIARRENHTDKAHAMLLTVMINDMLSDAGIQVSQLDAVAVSGGPGSYTGLRIGVSVAKGICYGLDIPLIAVSSLKAMCYMAAENDEYKQCGKTSDLFCPMIDARRMEVYSQLFTAGFIENGDVKAEIITPASYKDELLKHRIFFFGNGAEKCRESIVSENAVFMAGIYPHACFLMNEAQISFASGKFESTAYFEPFYLKDFIAGKPKKML